MRQNRITRRHRPDDWRLDPLPLDPRDPDIVHWSDFETGGHFAALETPELLVQDIRAFFAALPA